MLSILQAPLIVAIIFFFLYSIFELFARRKERILIVEKTNGLSNGLKNHLPDKNLSTSKFSTLKLGLLLTGIGMGLFVGILIADRMTGDYQIILSASTLFFGGLGLITAFIVEISTKSKK